MADVTLVESREERFELRGSVGGKDTVLHTFPHPPGEDEQALAIAMAPSSWSEEITHVYVARSTYTSLVEIDIL